MDNMFSTWLKKAKKQCAMHVHAASGSFQAVLGKPFSSLMTILAIGISLTLPVILWMCIQNMEGAGLPRDAGTPVVYITLKPHLNLSRIAPILEKLRSFEGAETIHLQHRVRNDNQSYEAIMLHVKTHEDAEHIFARVKAYLEPVPDIVTLRMTQDIEEKYHTQRALAAVLYGLLGFFAVSVVFIIMNTLRLDMRQHEDQICVLTLVGATRAYIMRPFLYQGLWYGLLGAVCAILFSNIIMSVGVRLLQDLAPVHILQWTVFHLSTSDAYQLVFWSFILGLLGAYGAIFHVSRDIEGFPV